jgi:hypothetical protein
MRDAIGNSMIVLLAPILLPDAVKRILMLVRSAAKTQGAPPVIRSTSI